jgi:hypothetical protein
MHNLDLSAREISSTAIMARQTRLLIPILLVFLVATIFSISIDFGGFARGLLLGALPQHAVFAAVLVFLFVLMLGPSIDELAIIVVASSMALTLEFAGILDGRVVPMAMGAACLLAILPRVMRGQAFGINRFFFVAGGSLLLPLASTLALIGQHLTVVHAHTYDLPAYLVDNAYGFFASAGLGRLLSASPSAHRLFEFLYGWLPAAVSACYVLNVRAGNPNAETLIKAALASGLVAFILYHFYPAAGPIYAFGTVFPAALPDPSTLVPTPTDLALPGAPRNCMPSVHFAWALLAALEARRLGRVSRAFFTIFAALTAFATMALGEHYLIDLVVAVPFTLAIHAACDRGRAAIIGRRCVTVFGAMLTAGWFVFLRLWVPPPDVSPILWILSVATIASSVAMGVAYFQSPTAARRSDRAQCRSPASPIRKPFERIRGGGGASAVAPR